MAGNRGVNADVVDRSQVTPSTIGAAGAGARAAAPVALAYIGIGFAAGVIGAEAGLSAAEVGLLSLLVFAGSAQFIFADLYTGAAAALIGTIFLVNLRHLLYATALTPRVRHLTPLARLCIGAQLTDETFALGTSLMGDRLHRAAWLIGLNMTAYTAWVGGNVTGAAVGTAAGALNGVGIEFALAAMFAALLVGQIRAAPTRRKRLIGVALLAGLLIVALDTVQPHPLNLVVATLIAASAGLGLSRYRNQAGEQQA